MADANPDRIVTPTFIIRPINLDISPRNEKAIRQILSQWKKNHALTAGEFVQVRFLEKEDDQGRRKFKAYIVVWDEKTLILPNLKAPRFQAVALAEQIELGSESSVASGLEIKKTMHLVSSKSKVTPLQNMIREGKIYMMQDWIGEDMEKSRKADLVLEPWNHYLSTGVPIEPVYDAVF